MLLNDNWKQAFVKHNALKIITGLNNFNLNNIICTVKAAELGGATYIDIACNINIIYQVKRISCLPICVSSIDPDELYACFQAGADILEIGNFDSFYEKGIILSADCIYSLAQEMVHRASSACICVTIPHTLPISQQIQLAKRIESLGVDMIQTEGISSQVLGNSKLINFYNNVSASLSSTYLLAQNITIPIISSSGINSLSAPIAISYGASGIGIGSFVSQFNNPLKMSLIIKSIVQSMDQNTKLDIMSNHLLLSSVLNFCNI
jgi:hypothetical protein